MTNIVDGYGSGYGARVGSDNRLWTYSSSTPAGVVASVNNKAWTVASNDITCTSDNESALLHLKYLGSYKLVVSALYLTAGASTGGSGNVEFRTYRNPTGGTIVTDEAAAEVGPKNFSGSASSLIGNSYAGTEGKTTTGGVNIARGRFRGWEDAHINLITVGAVKANVTLGYLSLTDSLTYSSWNAQR